MRETPNIFGVKASGERFSSYLLFGKKVLAEQGETNTKKNEMSNIDWILAYASMTIESLGSRLHGNDY